MEFFFLTQNNTVEIIILIILLVILAGIWGHDLYSWIGRVKTVFSTGPRRVSDVQHSIQKAETNTMMPSDTVSENDNTTVTNTLAPSHTDSVESMIDVPKTDTSHVEKIA